MNKKLDVFEVVLKQDIGIPLTPYEKHFLDNIDGEVKNTIKELVGNESFLDEIEKTCEHIIIESQLEGLSLIEQEKIKNKCEERIQRVKHPKSCHAKIKI